MPDDRKYTFRNPQPLARVVVTWLYADIAAALISATAAALALRDTAAADAGASKDTPLASDLIVALGGLVQFGVTLVVGFLVLKWIYRVNRNAHSAVRGLAVSPPWAVGFYFVPIAFLWKPFQAMRETWQVSTRTESWRTVPVPAGLRWWWGLFLLNSMLGQASFRIFMRAETLGDMAVSTGIDLVSAVVAVPLDLIFIWIVRELTRKQVLDLTFGNAAPLVTA